MEVSIAQRFKRSDKFVDSKKLLEVVGTCWREIGNLTLQAEIDGPIYKEAHEVGAAIGRLAFVITGDPEYFSLKVAPSTYVPPKLENCSRVRTIYTKL